MSEKIASIREKVAKEEAGATGAYISKGPSPIMARVLSLINMAVTYSLPQLTDSAASRQINFSV
jgi:hypothetical protein